MKRFVDIFLQHIYFWFCWNHRLNWLVTGPIYLTQGTSSVRTIPRGVSDLVAVACLHARQKHSNCSERVVDSKLFMAKISFPSLCYAMLSSLVT